MNMIALSEKQGTMKHVLLFVVISLIELFDSELCAYTSPGKIKVKKEKEAAQPRPTLEYLI